MYVVDAALIKVVKQFKQLSTDELTQHTIELIKRNYPKFVDLAEEDIVNKQINELIQKEYLLKRGQKIELM